MGDQPSHTKRQPDLDFFVDKSSLQYFIPRATDFSPTQFSKDGALPFDQLLDSIEHRESLFFGESFPDPRVVAFSPRSYTDPR
jgi:hypothetical protein